MSTNIRSSQRYKSLSFISYIRYDDNGKTIDEGVSVSVDLSTTGVRLGVDYPFNVNELVELTIGIKDHVVKAKAFVKRVEQVATEQFQIALEFSNISNEDRDVIYNYMHS